MQPSRLESAITGELELPTHLVRGQGQDSVDYACIQVDGEGIAELDDRGRAVFVPRDAICRVVLRYGRAAERPWLQVLFAAGCLAVAILTVCMFVGWYEHGGTISAKLIGGVAFGPLGLGVFWSLFRRRLFLRVETRNDARHLLFRGRIEPGEVRRFLEAAEASIGMPIEREPAEYARASSPYRSA